MLYLPPHLTPQRSLEIWDPRISLIYADRMHPSPPLTNDGIDKEQSSAFRLLLSALVRGIRGLSGNELALSY
jgi:hypothetical protein